MRHFMEPAETASECSSARCSGQMTDSTNEPEFSRLPGAEAKSTPHAYLVHWRSRYTDASGSIGPTSEAVADRIVERNGRLFPDIVHWAEPVQTAEPVPIALAQEAGGDDRFNRRHSCAAVQDHPSLLARRSGVRYRRGGHGGAPLPCWKGMSGSVIRFRKTSVRAFGSAPPRVPDRPPDRRRDDGRPVLPSPRRERSSCGTTDAALHPRGREDLPSEAPASDRGGLHRVRRGLERRRSADPEVYR